MNLIAWAFRYVGWIKVRSAESTAFSWYITVDSLRLIHPTELGSGGAA